HEVYLDLFHALWDDQRNLCPHFFIAKLPRVDDGSLSGALDVFAGSECQRAGRANGGAHGTAAGASAVITHVTLHHLVDLAEIFRHTERTGHHAIRTSDTSRLQRTLHNPIRRFLD